ncbi:MAG: LuxR C-terminal-related transcriptional regulator [Gammaproteobacteria bacterium]|nr:LuxR C-terminal-related transcriptional regulator [Gammaproteobacteria bacterium]
MKAIKLGAQDFLYKTTSLSVLSQSIQQALYHNHHHRLFEVNLYHANCLYAQLTLREKEVLYYVLRGDTNKIIAEKLDVTVKTIEAHRANIMKKMQVDSLSELVTLAVKYNIVKEDELCFFE